MGYMPKAFADDGGFIELCPLGISDELMGILHSGHKMGAESEAGHHLSVLEPQTQPISVPEMHHGHHQHQMHSGDHHRPVSHDHHQIVQVDTHSDHSNEHHASNWQNDCPYGLVASSIDLAFDVGFVLGVDYATGYKVAFLQSREIFARQQRKQQPRAPPHSQVV